MAGMTLEDVSKKMRDIDFAMLSTHTDGRALAARPMSNNRDVAYDGDSFFFTYDNTRTVADIEREREVGLSFTGATGLFGKPPIFIAVAGQAELIRDKAQFEAHWVKDLDRWFEQGVDTPGMILVKVHASRIHYWDGEDEGEIAI